MAERILVADDDVAALDGLRALLSIWGFEVQTATDGREALDRVSAVAPALVITDVVMPTMDGLELLTRLRKHQPRLPVIVVTGQGDDDTLRNAKRNGAYGYLSKPVDVGRLKSLLTTALQKS
jgi:DNA-binding NtrC family response regulator